MATKKDKTENNAQETKKKADFGTEEKSHSQDYDDKALVKLVMLSLDQEIYGVEINQVVEINKMLEITPIPNAPDYIIGLIDLRGEVIAVVDPEKRFALERQSSTEKKHIVVCQSEESKFGVLVDEVFKIINIPKDSINSAPDLIKTKIKGKYLKGVGILNDRVFVILDAAKMVSPEEIEEVKSLEGEKKKEEKPGEEDISSD